MNEGPDQSAADTTAETTPDGDLFEGIDLDGRVDFGGHPSTLEGQPEEAEAVDAEAAEKAPEGEADTPNEEPAESVEETPDPTANVNFDGFDDTQRTFFEKALKDGTVTPEFVEHNRKQTLMQSRFTKRMTEVKREEERRDAELAEKKELLGLLENVLGDDGKHEALLRKIANADADDPEDEEIADKRSAREIARQEFERMRAEERRDQAKAEQGYQQKKAAVQKMLAETRETLGIDGETMVGYLQTLEKQLPAGTDPIATIPPEEWERRITDHHGIVTRDAKIAKLQDALSKNKSKADQAAKQSLPPSQRVARSAPKTLYEQTCEEMGIDPTNPNVQGLGHLPGQR